MHQGVGGGHTSLRDKIAAFEKQGAVPAPKASFGSSVPRAKQEVSNRQLYGNRIGVEPVRHVDQRLLGVKKPVVAVATGNNRLGIGRGASMVQKPLPVLSTSLPSVTAVVQSSGGGNGLLRPPAPPAPEEVISDTEESDHASSEEEEDYPVHAIQQVEEVPIVVVEETIATSPPTRHVSGSYSNNNKKHLSTVLEVEAMAKVLESLEQHEALAQNQYDESMSMSMSDISQSSITPLSPEFQQQTSSIVISTSDQSSPQPTTPCLPPPIILPSEVKPEQEELSAPSWQVDAEVEEEEPRKSTPPLPPLPPHTSISSKRRPSLSVTTSFPTDSPARRHIRSTSSPALSSASLQFNIKDNSNVRQPKPTLQSHSRNPSTAQPPRRRAVTPAPISTYHSQAELSFDAPDLLGLIQAAAMLEERLTRGSLDISIASPPPSSSHHDVIPLPTTATSDSDHTVPTTMQHKRNRKRSFKQVLKRYSSKERSKTPPPPSSSQQAILDNPPTRKSSLVSLLERKNSVASSNSSSRRSRDYRSPSPPPPLPSKLEYYASLGRSQKS